METLADRLRQAMRAANMNQKQLAAAVGVKPPSIHGWLSEKAKFLRGEKTGKGDPNTTLSSATGSLDVETVITIAKAMQILMARRNRTVDLTDAEQAALFVDAYAELMAMRSGSCEELGAGAVIADLLAVREARARDRGNRSLTTGGVHGKKIKKP